MNPQPHAQRELSHKAADINKSCSSTPDCFFLLPLNSVKRKESFTLRICNNENVFL